MKNLISLILATVAVLFSVASCSNNVSDKETVLALTYYNEYDIDSIDFNELFEKAKTVFSDDEYLVKTGSNNENIYILPWDSNERAEKGYMIIEKYESVEKARDMFKSELVGTSPLIYRSVLIRINDMVLMECGGSLSVKMLKDYITDLPDDRVVGKELVQKSVDKEIDFDKFEALIEKNKCTKYDDPFGYDYIKRSDNISSIFWFNSENSKENSEIIFTALPTGPRGFLLAGTLLQYNNCAFIFLDDFWLDMIKQCEK